MSFIYDYSYSADTYTLTWTLPSLNWGVDYKIQVVDLLDSKGSNVAPISIEFSTYKNYITKEIRYNSYSGPHVSFYDGENNYSGSANYSSSGADGLWFTDDDELYQHVKEITDGNDSFRMVYSEKGNDNIWFTEDDVISSYSLSRTSSDDSTYEYFSYSSAGSDGIWLNSDDQILFYSTSNRDTGKRIYYDSPGPDSVWLTDDDSVLNYSISEDGSYHSYNNPGVDNIW